MKLLIYIPLFTVFCYHSCFTYNPLGLDSNKCLLLVIKGWFRLSNKESNKNGSYPPDALCSYYFYNIDFSLALILSTVRAWGNKDNCTHVMRKRNNIQEKNFFFPFLMHKWLHKERNSKHNLRRDYVQLSVLWCLTTKYIPHHYPE